MNWEEYIGMLQSEQTVLDRINLYMDDFKWLAVPPIIKSSILILEKMLASQGKRNVIVFPEKSQSSIIFAIMKTIYNITVGKIKTTYDPCSFRVGQRFKIKNSVVEFQKIDFHIDNFLMIQM